jgi:hypothetical protein
MLQQIIAILIIAFFVIRLFEQKRKKTMSGNEFLLWMTFWLIALMAIIFIRQIDSLVAYLGFSGAAINFLVYFAILALIYQVFRMRLKIAKMDKNISELNQELSLKK